MKSSPKMGGMSFEDWQKGKKSGFTATATGGIIDSKGFGSEPLSRYYVNHDDRLYRNLQKVKPLEGYEDIAVHGVAGAPRVAYETVNGQESEYTAKEFAEIIRNDPEYHGGRIRLLSCGSGSGKNCFAQQLADELNREVIAPTETLWVTEKGELFVSDNQVLAELWYDQGALDSGIKQTGEMKRFLPRGKEGKHEELDTL